MLAGIVDTVRVELDLAIEEVEERSEAEGRVPTIGKLVTSAVDPEIVQLLEPFRVSQEHDPDAEGIKAELGGSHDLVGSSDTASGVTLAELTRDDENVVVLLLFANGLEHLGGLGRLPDVLAVNLAFAPVVQLAPGLIDQVQNDLDCLGVGLGDLLPPWDGEPSLGAFGERKLGQLLVGVANARKEQAEDVGLLGDTLGLVAREVAVAGRNFLVLELVRGAVFFQPCGDVVGETRRVIHALSFAIRTVGEASLVVGRFHDRHKLETLRITCSNLRRSQCR